LLLVKKGLDADVEDDCEGKIGFSWCGDAVRASLRESVPLIGAWYMIAGGLAAIAGSTIELVAALDRSSEGPASVEARVLSVRPVALRRGGGMALGGRF